MATLDRHARDLRVAFRPVADLRRGNAVSFEALVALPDESPRSAAEWSEHGRVEHAGAVEARVLELAATARRRLPPRAMLVVTISAPGLLTAPVQQALAAAGSLDRLVLSIEDGDPVETFAIAAALEAAREDGARVAVHAGDGGRPELERIARLRPEIVRVDGALAREVADDIASAAAVAALVGLASRIDASVLAGDVRREGDLRALARLGVGLAMGPIVGRPTTQMEPLSPAVEALVAAISADEPAERTVAGLVESPIALPVETPLSDVVDALLLDPRNDFLVLVDDDQRPVALADRSAVLRAEPYERPVMWVLPDSPLKAVARRAVERPPLERFTPLVCCDTAGRYIGLARMERILSALAR
jgi:EAL domain-containing protein (putative c-di-GMP-specific phosphodiesterase class I)